MHQKINTNTRWLLPSYYKLKIQRTQVFVFNFTFHHQENVKKIPDNSKNCRVIYSVQRGAVTGQGNLLLMVYFLSSPSASRDL